MISWPSFRGTATLVGTTSDGRCTIYVDASLGAEAQQNATDLLADAPRVMALNDGYFGTLSGKVNVILFALGGATDGTGGADHMGCDYQTGQNIEVDVSYGNSGRCSALFEAELSECSMDNNLCGESTGEALSRWCANLAAPGALADFASAPTWAQDGYRDWVDHVENTDQDYDSIGCGMAFISWLLTVHGQSFPTVAQHMVTLGDSGTLAELYSVLTGDAAANAFPAFLAAVKALPGGVASDDPFAGTQPQPAPPPPSPPPPTPPPAPGPTPPPSPLPPQEKLQLLRWGRQLNNMINGLTAMGQSPSTPAGAQVNLADAAALASQCEAQISATLNSVKSARACHVGSRRLKL